MCRFKSRFDGWLGGGVVGGVRGDAMGGVRSVGYTPMSSTLEIAGVDGGSKRCEWRCELGCEWGVNGGVRRRRVDTDELDLMVWGCDWRNTAVRMKV